MNNPNYSAESEQRKALNLRTVVHTFLHHKKRFFLTWVIAAVLSGAYILCVPRTYEASVSLAPEIQIPSGFNSLSTLASSFGFDVGGMQGEDAISPELYPELFTTNNFIAPLFSIQVSKQDGSLTTDYYTYLTELQDHTPWDPALNWLKNLFASSDEAEQTGAGGKKAIDPYRPTRAQEKLLQSVQSNIKCGLDKKTDVITISVKDQDPLIAATLADSARAHLQQFITLYRTNKARLDVEYFSQLLKESEADYQNAMEAYTRYADSHNGDLLASFQTERDKLENDLQFALQNLTAVQQQLQNARAKVQETTPAFTILKHSSVPNKPIAPKRMIFVAIWLILSTVGQYLWIVMKEKLKREAHTHTLE